MNSSEKMRQTISVSAQQQYNALMEKYIRGHQNSTPLYSKKRFIEDFLYGLPLEEVQDLIKKHRPEVTI